MIDLAMAPNPWIKFAFITTGAYLVAALGAMYFIAGHVAPQTPQPIIIQVPK